MLRTLVDRVGILKTRLLNRLCIKFPYGLIVQRVVCNGISCPSETLLRIRPEELKSLTYACADKKIKVCILSVADHICLSTSETTKMDMLMITLHDHSGYTGRHFVFNFDESTELKELEAQIQALFLIPRGLQALSSDSREIRSLHAVTKLKEDLKMKSGDMVIVKHQFINNWLGFLASYKILRTKVHGEDQGTMARSLIDTMMIFETQNFFQCYNLQATFLKLYADIREYLGGFVHTIETAARYYFHELKKDGRKDPRAFSISFTPKTEGVHAGRVCHVKDHDGKCTYFVKTNHGGLTRSYTKPGVVPTLREVFGYCLLEEIKIGPESHFLCPPPDTAAQIIFIATKEIPNFENNRMDNLSSSTPNIEDTLIKIHTLCSILCLGDIHNTNCGQFNGEPIVMDFAIPFQENYRRTGVLDLIRDGTPGPVSTLVNGESSKELKLVAENCPPDRRVEIAVAAVKSWNLREAVARAKDRTDEVKAYVRSNGVEIEKTSDINNYIFGIEHNIGIVSNITGQQPQTGCSLMPGTMIDKTLPFKRPQSYPPLSATPVAWRHSLWIILFDQDTLNNFSSIYPNSVNSVNSAEH